MTSQDLSPLTQLAKKIMKAEKIKRSATKKEIPPLLDENKLLGKGFYGIVRGLSQARIREYLDAHKFFPKSKLVVKKQFNKEDDFTSARDIEMLVDRIDPSRQYLRGKIIGTPASKTTLMKNQGVDLERYEITSVSHLFENIHQLLIAIYILFRSGGVHYDIKRQNIIVDDRSPIKDAITMGLIDFDLMSNIHEDPPFMAYAYYFVWPLEMYAHSDHGRLSFFAETDPPVSSVVERTRNMIAVWTQQHAILRHLIVDPKEQARLFEVGKAAIVHYNHPDPIALKRQMDRCMVARADSSAAAYIKNERIRMYTMLVEAKRVAIDIINNRTCFSHDPIVNEYIETLFRQTDGLIAELDWTKIDPFGLGLVLIDVLLGKKKNVQELVSGAKDPDRFERDLRVLLFGTIHPDVRKRLDARALLAGWIDLLSQYKNTSTRRSVVKDLRRAESNLLRNTSIRTLDRMEYDIGRTVGFSKF